MLGFKDHLINEHREFLSEALELLNEKLIVFRGKRSKSGRIVFLAGGAGSGKGFSQTFMDISPATDKIRDVDEWKKAFIEIDKRKKKYPEIRNLDLRKPEDVAALHNFVDRKNIKNKSLDALLLDLKGRTLPNIVFDVTLKNKKSIEKVIPKLLELGYDSKDIHLVWVLTKFSVAVENNATRDRVVPDDIMLDTHVGAANTMMNILRGGVPKGLDGEIHIINNNKENTVFWRDKDGDIIPIRDKDGSIKTDAFGNAVGTVKDFLSIKVKDAGKKLINAKEVKKRVYSWIQDNIPNKVDIEAQKQKINNKG